jgi:hypothetical protein
MERLGRVIGYSASYMDEEMADQLTEAVDLFRTEDGAAAYAQWIAEAYGRSTPGSTSAHLDTADGGVLLSGSTETGDWTRIVFRSGAIVATLAFAGRAGDAPPVALRTLAAPLADRIDAARPNGRPYDLAHLMSATVPKADLPSAFSSLAWDPVFGGCWDTDEMVAQLADPADVAKDIATYGLEVQCLGMYSPQSDCPDPGACPTPAPDVSAQGIVRVATGISVLRSPEDAMGYRASGLARFEAAATGTAFEHFAVPGLPGALGLRRHVIDGETSEIETRVSFSRGDIAGFVFVHDRTAVDHRSDVIAMAKALEARMSEVLGTPAS